MFAQYKVSGGSGSPLLAESNNANKIDVYLLNGLLGAEISFTSSSSGTHQWYRYDQRATEAVPISSVQTGNTSVIRDVQSGYGYFVGSPLAPSTAYVWIVDYSKYVPVFHTIQAVEEEDKCEYLKIIADVEAEQINYRVPSGASVNLLRTYYLHYSTMKYEPDMSQFISKDTVVEWKGIISETVIAAPLENTYFTLTGDKFAEHFGLASSIMSDMYTAIAVAIDKDVYTDKEHASNEKHQEASAGNYGGSAPIEYTFTAIGNEPVAAFYIWKITEVDTITGQLNTIVRYTDKVLRYNFEKEGRYLVQLEVMDRNSTCVDSLKQPLSVVIGNTYLLLPNAFSPGSSIGVNDIYKVSYSSLLAFKASIYNRWGRLLYNWSDPSQGWDGRVNGKFVPTGVYYIIVEYRGTDGKWRSKSSDINILRSRN